MIGPPSSHMSCLEQHRLIRMFRGDGNVLCLRCVLYTRTHMWLLSTSNVACPAKELNFKFYCMFSHLNLSSHMWLVATILDSTNVYFPKS